MPTLTQLAVCGLALAAALPALADTRAAVTLDMQYAVNDLRPDDGIAPLGLVSAWYGGASTRRTGQHSSPMIADSEQFDSVAVPPVETALLFTGLDGRAAVPDLGDLNLSVTASTAALMTTPDDYWTYQTLDAAANATVGFYLGAYSSVTFTFNGKSEIIRSNPESDMFAAGASWRVWRGAAILGESYLEANGVGSPVSGDEQTFSFTLANNTSRGVLQSFNIEGSTIILAAQVPEPATYGMLALGLGLLWLRRRSGA